MRVLVTGGAGLVGSSIIDKLLMNGHEVFSLDNYISGKRSNLEHARSFDSFEEINGDILDERILESIFSRDIEMVFHEAVSKNTVCMIDPKRDLTVNAIGTLKLLEFSRDYKVRKFIHASTGSVYGQASYFPTDEYHPRNPVSFYGSSKLAAENYVILFNRFYGLSTAVLRYFHVFGSRQDSSEFGGVIPIFIKNALEGNTLQITGDGTQVRAFTHVDDIASINLAVAESEETSGEIFNCASDNRITIREVAEQILIKLEKSKAKIEFVPDRLGDIKNFDISNTKLKEFFPNFNFADFGKTLDDTIAAMKSLKNV